MHILIVTPVNPNEPGGIQTLTRNLEQGLTQQGHTTGVVVVERSNTSIADYYPRIWLDRPRDLPEWTYFNRVIRKTRRGMEQQAPDVVHAMTVDCWPAFQVAQETGVPSVLSTHGLELNRPRMNQSVRKRLNRVHAVSKFTAKLAQEELSISRDKIDVVHPSVDVNWPIPEETPDGPLFTIARHDRRKNIKTLIKAWKQLPKSLREHHGFIIGGAGERSEAIRAESHDDETISVVGRISENRKQKLFSKASVFALTPIRDGFDVEGFGIVYIEAQAQGTPVLGSNTGGVPEAVGNAGKVVDRPRDPDAIASALSILLTDVEARKR